MDRVAPAEIHTQNMLIDVIQVERKEDNKNEWQIYLLKTLKTGPGAGTPLPVQSGCTWDGTVLFQSCGEDC